MLTLDITDPDSIGQRQALSVGGKTFHRVYPTRFCGVCGKRISFRMSAKNVPESSDKQSKRIACCAAHAFQLRAQAIRDTLQAKQNERSSDDRPRVVNGWQLIS